MNPNEPTAADLEQVHLFYDRLHCDLSQVVVRYVATCAPRTAGESASALAALEMAITDMVAMLLRNVGDPVRRASIAARIARNAEERTDALSQTPPASPDRGGETQ